MIFGVSFINNNACKPAAICEGKNADARHAVADRYARKPCATTEGIPTDACHAVTYCHARKPGATNEGSITDARHGFCVIFGRNNKFRVRTSADSRHGIAGPIAVQRITKSFTWATNPANYANAVLIIVFCKLAVFFVTFFAHRLFGTCCGSAMAVFRFCMFVVERANPCMRICAFIFCPFSEVVSIWIYCNRQIGKRCFRFEFIILKYFVTNRTFVMRFYAYSRASRLYL